MTKMRLSGLQSLALVQSHDSKRGSDIRSSPWWRHDQNEAQWTSDYLVQLLNQDVFVDLRHFAADFEKFLAIFWEVSCDEKKSTFRRTTHARGLADARRLAEMETGCCRLRKPRASGHFTDWYDSSGKFKNDQYKYENLVFDYVTKQRHFVKLEKNCTKTTTAIPSIITKFGFIQT